MKKSKKLGLFSVLVILMVAIMMTGCSPQIIVGTYVKSNDNNSSITIVSIDEKNNSGVVSIKNFTAESYNIYNKTKEILVLS